TRELVALRLDRAHILDVDRAAVPARLRGPAGETDAVPAKHAVRALDPRFDVHRGAQARGLAERLDAARAILDVDRVDPARRVGARGVRVPPRVEMMCDTG